ncbi:MAG: bifunctional [glutamine synthetase] adenylyltransferase/[glutamine synthetase]-adenylyl-L-tyrosine phosphorylase [Sphingomonadaceae bacterium]|nr:bifunctional [glutamine synthetase] adenylyltransferase/[glutamine synthetase]-adenylyl-L-tyrosine phosphorylase [Sphingomonadaceae bacterium]
MAVDWENAIERARAHSPFLSLAMERQPELTALIAAGKGKEALSLARGAGKGIDDAAVALRRERLALSLALGLGDLAGAFPLSLVVEELSAFADRALDTAITEAIRHRVPDCEPAGFIGLALGKHGARELNYSSDIDPILLYDPETLPRRARDEPGEAAQRIARRLIETLSTLTSEGYVFRVDLRLRPASEVSPLAISVDAALTHYESSALAWERAAFIRARACSGDIAQGEAFLAAIRPFVWRKGLDFGAIDEIARLTAQIRANNKGSEGVGPGFDLKKGRGGIREVEFYAQTHQLIHGGRNPSLRVRGTRETLDALAAAELIAPQDAILLGESYDRLRTFEHRLQMVHDRQTHSLPDSEEALDSVARLHGLADGKALIGEITEITEAVGSRYDDLLAANVSTASTVKMPRSGPALENELEQMGFADPHELAPRITGWKSGRFRALRSDAAFAAFDAIEPALLSALAAAPEPDRAIRRWERLLTNLPSALNLFNLLEARPGLIDLLARAISLADPLADELSRRADLLDPLINASAFDLPGSVDDLAKRLSRREAHDGYEEVLDSVRREVGELRFALGIQLIESTNDPLEIGAALSRIAEAAVQVLGDAATREFHKAHGEIPESELVILGLGRLGGAVLTHASDLDLVFLFTGDHSAESGGDRPIGATLYYNRLCQRVIAALSVPTAEGALYEIDTRLRPSGAQGPPAASLDSFARYQNEQAWTWEHMALARARPIFGSQHARNELSGLIEGVLTAPRDPGKLKAEVLKMRGTMAEHKKPKGALDIKLARGGLVDLEFLVHYLQLRDGAALIPNLGEAVRALVSANLLPATLIEGHDAMTRFLIASRLLAHDSRVPHGAARKVLASSCGFGDWDSVIRTLGEARATVASSWAELFGETLEITQ